MSGKKKLILTPNSLINPTTQAPPVAWRQIEEPCPCLIGVPNTRLFSDEPNLSLAIDAVPERDLFDPRPIGGTPGGTLRLRCNLPNWFGKAYVRVEYPSGLLWVGPQAGCPLRERRAGTGHLERCWKILLKPPPLVLIHHYHAPLNYDVFLQWTANPRGTGGRSVVTVRAWVNTRAPRAGSEKPWWHWMWPRPEPPLPDFVAASAAITICVR